MTTSGGDRDGNFVEMKCPVNDYIILKHSFRQWWKAPHICNVFSHWLHLAEIWNRKHAHGHWNKTVVISTKVSTLVAPDVVIFATSGSVGGENCFKNDISNLVAAWYNIWKSLFVFYGVIFYPRLVLTHAVKTGLETFGIMMYVIIRLDRRKDNRE